MTVAVPIWGCLRANPETTDPKECSYLTIVDNRIGHLERVYGSNCLLLSNGRSTSSTSSEKVVSVVPKRIFSSLESQCTLTLYMNERPSPISSKTS